MDGQGAFPMRLALDRFQGTWSPVSRSKAVQTLEFARFQRT
jgi:hypothetical protein